MPFSPMSSDPRVHKPRLPKAYTDQQLAFLKSNLPEFERRSQGSIRGDAKKFALERASDFIVRFGLPDEFVGVEESESRFKEQIYNWFKNTIGRTRRKLEGRPRSAKKAAEKAAHANELPWNTNVATPNIVPYSHAESSHNSPVATPQTIISPIQYGGLQPTSSLVPPPVHATPTPSPHIPHSHPIQTMNISQSTLREAFLQGVDSSTLASMIQSYVLAHPSSTPLTTAVDALFDAVSSESSSSYNRDPHTHLRRFLDASSYFSTNIIHAGVSGPLAGPRALQMQIRRFSTWMLNASTRPTAQRSATLPATSSSSLSDEMQRIASDRQRRKDHIQWARIHAAALELGIMAMGRVSDAEANSLYGYAIGRAFSEMMARDAVWESDEVEWVAGICVLRSVIRTAMRGDRRQRDEYDELLRAYEDRWKEIKDEARQALVTEVLLTAKDDLARLDESVP
ncbi:hypothetical protein BDQ12DRAFT_693144 [Crucibulum laeve]|uniref:Uncharacterized protein n=1 Tax=Crucibulum laeve TaxID=68775 RepID=A0A5C3LGV0_9AGAR|nr:hypothetical protein BDQ12DRAFT_693144 [Crucibulum laeve]